MISRGFSIATVLAILHCGPAQAQDVESCRGIADGLERLTCYDNIQIAESAAVDVNVVFEEFRELVSYTPVATANGPYGAEVEWRFTAAASQWLQDTYNEFVRRDISLMQEGVKMKNCSLDIYQTWRIRGGYGMNAASALEVGDTERQGLLARSYLILLDEVDIEATRASGTRTIVMQRGSVVASFEHVRRGWTDTESLNPLSAEADNSFNSGKWEMVRFDSDRTMEVLMGMAYRPEDSALMHGVFLEMAQACQQ